MTTPSERYHPEPSPDVFGPGWWRGICFHQAKFERVVILLALLQEGSGVARRFHATQSTNPSSVVTLGTISVKAVT